MIIKSKLLLFTITLQYMILLSNEKEHHQILFHSSLVLQVQSPSSTFNINKHTNTTITGSNAPLLLHGLHIMSISFLKTSYT